MSKIKQAGYLLSFFFILAGLTATSVWAKKSQFEKKGNFGVTVYGNYVNLSYLITYLGESYKPGKLTFQMELEDPKGFDLFQETVESECKLKNFKNQQLPGKIERVTDKSIRMIFPMDEGFETTGKIRLYAVIRDYKLLQTFKQLPSSVALNEN
ncbi:MAG TPA: hypothetical protein VM123_18445 [archaeon]|nr:hypothetical protein [archaeon]